MSSEDHKIQIKGLLNEKEITVNKNMTVEDLKFLISFESEIPFDDLSIYYKSRNLNINEIEIWKVFDFKEKIEITIKKNISNQKKSQLNNLNKKKQGGLMMGGSGGMESLLKNPMVKNMLKNPQTIKSMKSMFPDLMEDNEMFDSLINSGQLEEEMDKMASDSDYLNSQLRNADVAMAKLENMPGGMNIMNSYLKGMNPSASNLFNKNKTFNVGGQINNIDQPSLTNKKGTGKFNPFIQYRSQNATLVDFGFSNVSKNFKVLTQTNGDLENAIEILNGTTNVGD